MSVITEISPKKGNKKRFCVYVDGQFTCFLDEFSIYKYKLKVGTEISSEKLQEIQLECEQGTAFDVAIKYLSKYIKTEKELRKYLYDKGYMPAVVNDVMQKVLDYGYLSDKNLAKTYASQQQNKYGKNKIKFMLKSRGVNDENIEEALEQIENQEEAALQLALKHLKNKEKTKENMQKTSKYLFGKGFVWEDISSAMNKICKEWEDENW